MGLYMRSSIEGKVYDDLRIRQVGTLVFMYIYYVLISLPAQSLFLLRCLDLPPRRPRSWAVIRF